MQEAQSVRYRKLKKRIHKSTYQCQREHGGLFQIFENIYHTIKANI